MSSAKICTDITELSGVAQKACKLFLDRCEGKGLKVRITETYRSQERQNALYAKGRTEPGNIVTWTKNSRHTSRRAWDICQNVKGKEYSDREFFKSCGAVAKELNITWGGSWSTPDMPHFEIGANWTAPAESEVNAMTAEEKKEFDKLKRTVSELDSQKERVYHYTEELPDWAHATVQKLLDKGIYAGAAADDLNLPEGLMRVLVINDRAGLYK
ncbi:MAG: M15 family metallopeptidase [Clostridiales bacterium]|nr:M15 family metallopeptidase [Clostridiales bacterium]